MPEPTSDLPADLLDLQCLSPQEVRILHEELGIASLGTLEAASNSGKVEALAGFGKESVEKILRELDDRKRLSGRFLRADVAPVAEQIVGILRSHPDVTDAEVVGTYRRERETVDDLHFLVATTRPTDVTEFFTEIEDIQQVILQSNRKAAVRLKNGLPCDLRAVTPAEWPFALLHFTGSKEHLLEVASRALKQGLTLNEYHLAPVNGETWNDSTLTFKEEADIYRELGLSYIDPKLRENRGEFEAAETGEIIRAPSNKPASEKSSTITTPCSTPARS